MNDVQEVMKRLPNLSKVELDQVRQRITFLGGGPKIPEGEDWLLTAFLSELHSAGMTSAPRSPKLLGAILPKDYKERAVPIRDHLLAGYGGTHSYAEKLALGRVAASALADYLRRARVPVTPKTLFANLDKVPQALENAFPGYWRARALGACLHQKVEA